MQVGCFVPCVFGAVMRFSAAPNFTWPSFDWLSCLGRDYALLYCWPSLFLPGGAGPVHGSVVNGLVFSFHCRLFCGHCLFPHLLNRLPLK